MESMEFLLILFVGFQAHFVIGGSPPVIAADSPSKAAYLEADQFLTSYGYYPSSGFLAAQARQPNLRNHSETERTKALKLFQKFSNLPETGKLDKETTQLMQSPRCGNPDITPNLNTMGTSADFDMEEEEDIDETIRKHTNQETEESGVNVDREKPSLDMSRKKRMKREEKYKPRKWRNKVLKWSLDRENRPNDEEKHREDAKKAFRYWQPLVRFDFKFQENSYRHEEVPFHMYPNLFIWFHRFDATSHPMKNGDEIYVNVKRWDNGTKYLDTYLEEKGMQTQLERKRRNNRKRTTNSHAHALQPSSSIPFLAIHLDDLYHWSSDEFYQVLLHEIGHVLGLEHKSQKSSIMNPYNLGVSEFSFSDLRDIESLYGIRNDTYECDAKFRQLKGIIIKEQAPTSKHDETFYYFFTGKKVQYMSEKRRIRKYDNFKSLFPNVTSDFDLAFPYVKKTIIFIKLNGNTPPGGKLYQHDLHTKELLHEIKFGPEAFPETPKFAVTIDKEAGGRRTRMFGATRSWDFKLKGDKIVYHSLQAHHPSLEKIIKVAKLAVLRKDSWIYFLTRNGRFTKIKPYSSKVYKKVRKGYPHWIRQMLCEDGTPCDSSTAICYTSRGHSTKGSGMSKPGLMLVIMLSLITRY